LGSGEHEGGAPVRVILNAHEAMQENPRGISQYTINLYRKLFARGRNDYACFYFDKDGTNGNRRLYDKYFACFNAPVHEIKELHYSNAAMHDVYKKRSMADYCELKGDLLYLSTVYGCPSNPGLPLVAAVHDLFTVTHPEYFNNYRYVAGFAHSLLRLKKANPTVIANSQYTKAEFCYRMDCKPETVYTVYPGYDDTVLYPDHAEDFKCLEPYFLYLGAVDERKNIGRILDAFEILKEKHGEIKLVIAGGIDVSGCETAKRAKGMDDRDVVFLGFVDDDKRRKLLSGCIAFLFPSLDEGFGSPVIEAMACGAPVITSNRGAMPEAAGEAAVLVDPFNAEQLKSEMERLLLSEALRSDLKAKGHVRCRCFSWDKTAQETEAVFESALAGKP
jgi:glycosyltransferase involved in cell wall biosynthesis